MNAQDILNSVCMMIHAANVSSHITSDIPFSNPEDKTINDFVVVNTPELNPNGGETKGSMIIELYARDTATKAHALRLSEMSDALTSLLKNADWSSKGFFLDCVKIGAQYDSATKFYVSIVICNLMTN